MGRRDFRSTDLAGAAYYAGIFDDSGFDPCEAEPSRAEVSADDLLSRPVVWPLTPAPVGVDGPRAVARLLSGGGDQT